MKHFNISFIIFLLFPSFVSLLFFAAARFLELFYFNSFFSVPVFDDEFLVCCGSFFAGRALVLLLLRMVAKPREWKWRKNSSSASSAGE